LLDANIYTNSLPNRSPSEQQQQRRLGRALCNGGANF